MRSKGGTFSFPVFVPEGEVEKLEEGDSMAPRQIFQAIDAPALDTTSLAFQILAKQTKRANGTESRGLLEGRNLKHMSRDTEGSED